MTLKFERYYNFCKSKLEANMNFNRSSLISELAQMGQIPWPVGIVARYSFISSALSSSKSEMIMISWFNLAYEMTWPLVYTIYIQTRT